MTAFQLPVTYISLLTIQFQNSDTLYSKHLDIIVFHILLQRVADENVGRSWQNIFTSRFGKNSLKSLAKFSAVCVN